MVHARTVTSIHSAVDCCIPRALVSHVAAAPLPPCPTSMSNLARSGENVICVQLSLALHGLMSGLVLLRGQSRAGAEGGGSCTAPHRCAASREAQPPRCGLRYTCLPRCQPPGLVAYCPRRAPGHALAHVVREGLLEAPLARAVRRLHAEAGAEYVGQLGAVAVAAARDLGSGDQMQQCAHEHARGLTSAVSTTLSPARHRPLAAA